MQIQYLTLHLGGKLAYVLLFFFSTYMIIGIYMQEFSPSVLLVNTKFHFIIYKVTDIHIFQLGKIFFFYYDVSIFITKIPNKKYFFFTISEESDVPNVMYLVQHGS